MKKLMGVILILIPIVLLLIVKVGMVIVVSSEIITVESITITTVDSKTVDQDTKIYNLMLTEDSVSVQLESTILPIQATDKSHTYTITSGSDIATITEDGLLTATWYGDVVVQVTAASGKKDVVTINVYDDYTHQVTVNELDKMLYVGDTLVITASIVPTESIDKTIQWSSSDSSVLAVDGMGNLVAKKVGTATITATTADTGITHSVEIEVYQEVTGVSAITTAYSVAELVVDLGSNYIIAPSTADNVVVTYSSSDDSIATVDSDGLVTFSSAGSVEITILATSYDHVDSDGNAKYKQTVVDVTSTYGMANSITFVSDSLQYDYVSNQILSLEYTTMPSTGVDTANISYISDNTSVVAIVNGQPTVVGGGYATITITVAKPDGTTAKDTIDIYIVRVAESFTIMVDGSSASNNYFTVYSGTVVVSAEYLPTDATNKGLVIASTDNKSTISGYTIVFASGYGIYELTASCGDVTVSFSIYYQDNTVVNNTVEEPTDSDSNASLGGVDYEDSFYIATDKVIASVDADSSALTVDEGTLEVTALLGGSHTITVTYTDGTSEDIDIFVTRYADDYELAVELSDGDTIDDTTNTIVSTSDTYSIAPAYSPADTTETASVTTYTSSDTSIATVDADGTVTFLQAGTVTITVSVATSSSSASSSATAMSKVSAMSKVVATTDSNVIQKTVTIRSTFGLEEYVEIKTSDVYQYGTGNTIVLDYSVYYSDDSTCVESLASSDSGVVSVDQEGNVTVIGYGIATVTITATITDKLGNFVELSDSITFNIRQEVSAYDVTVSGTTSSNNYFVTTSSSVTVTATNYQPTGNAFDPSISVTTLDNATISSGRITFGNGYGVYQFVATIDNVVQTFYIYYTNSRYSAVSVDNVEIEYDNSYYLVSQQAISSIEVVSGQFTIGSDLSIVSTQSGAGRLSVTYVDGSVAVVDVYTVRYATYFELEVEGYDSGTEFITSAKLQFVFSIGKWSTDDVTQTDVAYTSSNSSIATVDASGVVTFHQAGTVTITVSAYISATSTTTKTVEITSTYGAVSSFTLDTSSITLSDIGDSATISFATVAPADYDATASWAVAPTVTTSDYYTFDLSTMTITATKSTVGSTMTLAIGTVSRTVNVAVNKLVESVKIAYGDDELSAGKTYYTFLDELTLVSGIVNTSSTGNPTVSTTTFTLVGDSSGATITADGKLALPESYNDITICLTSDDGNASATIILSQGTADLVGDVSLVSTSIIYAPSNDSVELELDLDLPVDVSYILGGITDILTDNNLEVSFSGEAVEHSYSVYGNVILDCIDSQSNNTTTITVGSSTLQIQWFYLNNITLTYDNTNDLLGLEEIRVFGNLWYLNDNDDLDDLVNTWSVPYNTNLSSAIKDTSSILYWFSSDTSVATVDSNGMITVLKYGTGTDYSVTVTITLANNADLSRATISDSYTFIFVEGVNVYTAAQFDSLFEVKTSSSYKLTYYNAVLHDNIVMTSHAVINGSYITAASEWAPYRFESGEAIYGNGNTIDASQVYLDAIWLYAKFNGSTSAYTSFNIGVGSAGLYFAGNNLVTNVTFLGAEVETDSSGALDKSAMMIASGDKTYNGETTDGYNSRWTFYSGYQIQYCEFRYTGYGVALQDGASGSISNTAILHNGSYGIMAYGGDIVLTDVVIADAGLYGIAIDDMYTDGTVTEVKDARIYIEGFLDIYNIRSVTDYDSTIQSAMESFFSDASFEDFVIENGDWYVKTLICGEEESSGCYGHTHDETEGGCYDYVLATATTSGAEFVVDSYQMNMTIVYMSDSAAAPSSGLVFVSDGSGGWVDVSTTTNDYGIYNVSSTYTYLWYKYYLTLWGYHTDIGIGTDDASDHYIQPNMEYSDSLYKLYRSY